MQYSYILQIFCNIINHMFHVMVNCVKCSGTFPRAVDLAGEFLAAKQTNDSLDALVASFLGIPEANLPYIFLPPDNFSGFKADLSIWTDELLEEIDDIFLSTFPLGTDIGSQDEAVQHNMQEYSRLVIALLSERIGQCSDSALIERLKEVSSRILFALQWQPKQGSVPLPLLTKSVALRINDLLNKTPQAIKEVSFESPHPSRTSAA